jgi:hypothetical protein
MYSARNAHHEDKVSECWRVDSASRAGPHDAAALLLLCCCCCSHCLVLTVPLLLALVPPPAAVYPAHNAHHENKVCECWRVDSAFCT